MGVMACDRNKCKSVMSEYFSAKHGYLCSRCRDELIEKPFVDIDKFMMSSPVDSNDKEAWHTIVNCTFKKKE